MKQKLFYTAFSVIYDELKTALNLTQKEAVFNLIFSDLYQYAGVEIFDYDQFRKITSGINPIHSKVRKKLHTCEGFELFRSEIENNCLPYLKNILSELLEIFNQSENIPQEIKSQIHIEIADDYHISRTIAAILDCLDYSDYLVSKGKNCLFDVGYMRLSADNAPAIYPKYITESPENGINLIGRENDIDMLNDVLIKNEENLLVTAVGGLGKTELVKRFLSEIREKDVNECGVEVIAWVQYNNNDLRMSIKQAFHMKCEIDEVWTEMQNISDKYEKRMLLVVDNIEVSDDEYLRKLSQISCRILVTSRYRGLSGFNEKLELQPLSIDNCRELFYRHYKFEERNNEILNDIIELTAKLTIMIVFIAKAAYAEGFSLLELYTKLVEKGFKLSEEDVSCEHEKMHNDETIIKQMCILFSLVKYSNEDKKILTYISVIPNLKFDFTKAKKWFDIRKNSRLLALFNVGMLEHVTEKRTHIYWMHSVIAAAIREQQKEHLYELSRPFVSIISEELDTGETHGREYEKAYLIPFSWSIADIMESHWNDEKDTDFLTRLFHVCFACSNYHLCEHLINIIIEVQKNFTEFSVIELAYSYRNKIDLLLQFDHTNEAAELFDEVKTLFNKHNVSESDRDIMNSQYGIYYQIKGDYKTSKYYFDKCIEKAKASTSETRKYDLSTAYSNTARMLIDAGWLEDAYTYTKKAIETQGDDELDSDIIICYSTLASICTEFMNRGYGTTYIHEALDAFDKVIKFREKNLGKHHADTALAYHEYSYFLYVCHEYDEALNYNKKARQIDIELFSEYSINVMRNSNTKALILWEKGDKEKASEIFDYIIEESEKMGNNYLVDVADFALNYARCLAEIGNTKKSKDMYQRCISIWSSMSENGNMNLAVAHLEFGDILYNEQNISGATENYQKSVLYNTEDFYIMVDSMDSLAVCLLLQGELDSGLEKFKELLELLTLNKANDSDTKYQLCNNLSFILDAHTEEELELRNMLIEKIKDNEEIMGYVNTFFINSDEK